MQKATILVAVSFFFFIYYSVDQQCPKNKAIKDTKSIKTTVDWKSVPNNLQDKLIEFNCSECDLTFNLKSAFKGHSKVKHDKHRTEASSENSEDTLFQKLRSKIVPAEPDDEFKLGKCGFNAGTVSNFMNHICAREMTIVPKKKILLSLPGLLILDPCTYAAPTIVISN